VAFVFRLEKILQLRRARENEELRKLKELEGELFRYQDARNATMKAMLQSEAELRRLEQSGESLYAWGIYFQRLAYLRGRLAELDVVIKDCRDRISKQREVLIEATKNRKVLENLREKQLAAYELEELRKEQSVLDDIAGQLYQRKKEDE